MALVLDPSTANPPPPSSATSSDGFLTAVLDGEHAGVLLKADYTSEATRPNRVRFFRDGEPVRSGNVAQAPGGYAVAYDHEAPLGVASTWTAVPIFRTSPATAWATRDGLYDGTSTAPVAMVVPEPSGGVDGWLKPVGAPSLSMCLPMVLPDPEFSEEPQATITYIPGSRTPGGTWDKRNPQPRDFTFRVRTVDERDAFLECIDQGPVLFQCRRLFGIHDMFCLPMASKEAYLVGAFDARRDMTLTLQPMGRPTTLDAPLFVPGRGYDDRRVGTYDARSLARPTYEDSLG